MYLRQLEHFVAVAEERHFTRAAKRAHIVQSGLSASIRALEEELGGPLLTRSTRRVELTAAGQALYEKAQLVLAAARDARDAVIAIQGLKRGTLTIGTVQSLAAFLDLPALLGRFRDLYPGIDIRLSQGSATELVDKLDDGRIDVGFLPLFEPPGGIATTLITCEPLVIACASQHRLAGRRDVQLGELEDESFIDFQADWGTRRLVDRAFDHANVVRHIAFEVADLGTLLALTARSLGIALVPEAIAKAPLRWSPAQPVATATLAEPEICWELVVAFSDAGGKGQPKNPAAKGFLELLAQVDRT